MTPNMTRTWPLPGLPPQPYWPGQTERPDEAVFEPLKSGIDTSQSPKTLQSSPAFQTGLAAFAHRYFWEAHEIWEPIWLALPPASAERHLMQGLIQLANAGLKRDMGNPRAADRIQARAEQALDEAFINATGPVLGFNPKTIDSFKRQVCG